MNILRINVRKKISNDEYEGSINIQSTRPIFGTSYISNVFNFVDNNFRFKYLEYQSIDYNPNTHGSNLTAVLAFYVNIILGIDFSTYSENGGYEYFNNALTIDEGKNGLIVGPVTLTSVTCAGNLQCVGNLAFTTTLTIGTNGSLNII